MVFVCNKKMDKKIKKIEEKIDKLQSKVGIVKKSNDADIQSLFESYDKNTEKNEQKIKDSLQHKRKILSSQYELLIRVEKLIEDKKHNLEQLNLDLEKQDLYIRKQYIVPKRNIFSKVVIVLLIVLISLFLAFLTPSIRKRIEYNPYITAEKSVFVENYINEYEGEKL